MERKAVRAVVAMAALLAVAVPLPSGAAGPTEAEFTRQFAYNTANSPRPSDTLSFNMRVEHDRVEWRVRRVDSAKPLTWTISNNQDEHVVTCTLAANADVPSCPIDPKNRHYHRPSKSTITLRPQAGQGAVLVGIWGDPNPR